MGKEPIVYGMTDVERFTKKKKELKSDLLRRWGAVQVCRQCLFVAPYVDGGKVHHCCGQEMSIERECH